MSTLIHFTPLLTTTAPCGQYFFFAFTRKIQQHTQLGVDPAVAPIRPLTKPSPPPRAKMASCAKKFDGIWMRADDFFVEKFLGQRNNFDLSCKINTMPVIV